MGVTASVFWKRMWKIRVPPKVKDLLWRAAANCLPTKSLLLSRHVNVDAICPLCQTQRETVTHCLIDIDVMGSFASWLDDRMRDGDDDRRKLVAVACWVIWKTRNEVVWNNKGTSVGIVVALVHSVINQWDRAQNRNVSSTAAYLTEVDGDVKWTKSVGDVIKINVDAAIFRDTERYSFACVACSSTVAVKETISACVEGRIVETDSLTVVQSICTKTPMLSYFGRLINECRELLEEIPEVSLVFIRRSANGVFHFLARASYYVADRIIGSDDISSEFLDVIMKDCQ